MQRFPVVLLGSVFFSASLFAQAPPATAPTYTKDVVPILQKHCQTCHRPGEAGPFSMLTFEDTKPWAPTMKLVVQQKIMPPWFADPKFGHFVNERSLSTEEIRTLVAWVNGGAQKGDPKDMPPPVKFEEGWGIPKPDVVFQLPKEFSVPDSGMIGSAPAYSYIYSWRTPVLDNRPGSFHACEIAFTFDNAELCDHYSGGTPEAFVLSKQISTAWVNFARTGNPNHDGLPHWPTYTPEHRATMYFNTPCEVRNNPEGEGLRLMAQS